jgi:hypothetical protein
MAPITFGYAGIPVPSPSFPDLQRACFFVNSDPRTRVGIQRSFDGSQCRIVTANEHQQAAQNPYARLVWTAGPPAGLNRLG